MQILLKPGNPGDAINPSHFYPIALDGGNGGNWYEDNIRGCWPDIMQIGDWVEVEPGNMIGPTGQGVDDLVAMDPGAYWDGALNDIMGNAYSPSPRTVVIPVFDPYVYEMGREAGRIDIQVTNLVGFFIERMVGNDVLGRIVPATGLIRGNGGGPAPEGSFLRAIRLVN